jgi:hypothetical protein
MPADAVEGRDDAHACQLGLGQRHLGLGHFQRRGALVDRTLADEVLGHQLAVALQVGAGDAGLRLGLLQLRLLQRVVELHQQLAAAHALAVAETQRRDAAADLGPQHHALHATQRAHACASSASSWPRPCQPRR